MPTARTATLVGAGAVIIIAQVILPAAIDLMGSIALLGIGAMTGWKAAKAQD